MACKAKSSSEVLDLRNQDNLATYFGSPTSRCEIIGSFIAPTNAPRAALALVGNNAGETATGATGARGSSSAASLSASARTYSYKQLLLRVAAPELAQPLKQLLTNVRELSPEELSALSPAQQLQQLQVNLGNEVRDTRPASASGESREYYLSIEGVPLCDFHTKVILLGPDAQAIEMGSSLVGTLDDFPANVASIAESIAKGTLTWNTDTVDFKAILPELEKKLPPVPTIPSASTSTGDNAAAAAIPFGLVSAQKCLFRDAGVLSPGWKFSTYSPAKKLYQVLVKNQRLAEVHESSFHASGSATIYKPKSSSETQTVALGPNLQNNGFLCSDLLTTTVPDDKVMAYSPDLVFNYLPGDFRFNEVSAFYSINEMWNYFLAKNPQANWSGSQIEIRLSEDPSIESSGPYYENPNIESTVVRPRINAPLQLKQGSKLLLINLATDSTALAHELGHHILYQYVGVSSAEEQKILHEAVADAFVMFKDNEPCLGPTICPASSYLCTYGKKTCLRTAENSLTYDGDEYQVKMAGDFHVKDQLLTGLLWDLHKKDGLSTRYLGDLLYKAISFLPWETNFADFLLSLQLADAALSKGVNACTIATAAKRRGMGSRLSQMPCENFAKRAAAK
jgi:hypothetical protein